MVSTKKRVYKRKFRKNKKRTKTKTKTKTKRIKKMKLKTKNLGKKSRSYKRIQYGCSSKKNMKGGGPIFQPLTDLIRGSAASTQDFSNKFNGNDPARNEQIVTHPASLDSNYNSSSN